MALLENCTSRQAASAKSLPIMSPISAGSKSRKKKNTLWIVLSAALAALVFLFNFWSGETSVDTGDLNGMDSALHDLQRNFWTQRVSTYAEAKASYRSTVRHADESIPSNNTSPSMRWPTRLIDAGRCLADRAGSTHAACLPSLLCIGAMKAGTFELRQWLAEHPLVHAAKHERHFFGFGDHLGFDQVSSYARGEPKWLLSRHQINQGAITFEKTPYYLSSTVAAMELHQLLPSAKLVVLLRDPKARAYSSFYHHCRNRRIVVIPRGNIDHDNEKGDEVLSESTSPFNHSRVVFNQDCATAEHCCCAPHDLRPRGHSDHLGRRFKAPRGLRAKLEARASDAWASMKPRQMWQRARSMVSGTSQSGDGENGDDGEGGGDEENDSYGNRDDNQKGRPLALEACDADAFEQYLASTSMDAEGADLGTVLRKGLYSQQLNTYLELFGRKQLLVMDGASFARDPHHTLNRVFDFALLPNHTYGPEAVAQNEKGYWFLKGRNSKANKPRLVYGAMSASSLAKLSAFYAQPDEELRALFPEEHFSWLPPLPRGEAASQSSDSAQNPAAAPRRRTENLGEDEEQQSWMNQGR